MRARQCDSPTSVMNVLRKLVELLRPAPRADYLEDSPERRWIAIREERSR